MTPLSITVAAHAKINLVLRILERETSGYHRLATLFQRVALADAITIAPTDGTCAIEVTWDGAPGAYLGAPEQNLAWRAAAAYREVADWPAGWSLALTKRIPAGAGLGGGSSDAASVLRGLDALAPTPLGVSRLTRIGAALGADVPFFVTDVSLAIGRGRGDVLRSLAPLPTAAIVLAVPRYGIATAEAYADLAAARAASPDRPALRDLRDSDDFGSWEAVARQQANDFEPTVLATHPELMAVQRWFEEHGAKIARLSGSGSVVFGLWPPDHSPTPPLAPSLAPLPGFGLLTTTTA